MSQSAVTLGDGYLPNAEEAEHVVYAVGVEILGGVGQTSAPPTIAVGSHRFPIVGRESPVLSLCGKGIGRCAGGSVEVEQLAVFAGGHAVAADTDGYVALEHYAALAGYGMDFAELAV